MTDGDKAAAAAMAAAYCTAKGTTEIVDLMRAYDAFLREIRAHEIATKKPAKGA